MKKLFILLCKVFVSSVLITVIFGSCVEQKSKQSEITEINIIPKPKEIKVTGEMYTLPKNTTIFIHSDTANKELQAIAHYLNDILVSSATAYTFETANGDGNIDKDGIHFVINDTPCKMIGEEGYHLDVEESVVVTANNPRGIFYGIQTLLQLLPPEIMGKAAVVSTLDIPQINIVDEPRFKHRGMMLDVCRHFVTVDSVKRFIDLLAMHKMNSFHWHLTEDQGWRIEIKKYPRLTEVGSKRKESVLEKNFNPYIGDGIPHEGFYSQEEIKDVVEYAKARYINIIPEIELPGHSSATLAAYPQLGCTGGPYEVSTVWGVRDDVLCAGNDSVFIFLEDVLDEVLALFPSKLIHIGGDECPKVRWKECPDCQARIKEEGLLDEHELQSYFITRVEKHLNSKGRILIGWDEILEGGLAPNAIVMSWRGMQGGIEAAKQKHYVIMSPTSHCYFDFYQGEPENEPLAIGGYTPLKKVYSFEPVPEDLNEDEAKYILGAQANLWTEYMPHFRHMEYMITPRISALSEVVWSTPENRDWEDFQQRLKIHVQRFEAMNVNYSKGSSRISFIPHFNKEYQQHIVELEKENSDMVIYYTTDGSEPDLSANEYQDAIPINKTTTLKAISFIDGKPIGKTYEQEIIKHKAVGAKIKYTNNYNSRYAAGGDLGLLDGIISPPSFNREFWQGFKGIDFEAIIDLGQETDISKISIGFLHRQRSWIYRPNKLEIFISTDGENYTKVFSKVSTIDIKDEKVEKEEFILDDVQAKAKYIKVFAEGVKENPEWHANPGETCWIFADEIVVE